ncbi:MAG: radical SAM protein [Candidatus Omnitrophica bacterium]|nr:radical SAM protein [Candidatus Omnitrophota bacterium]
MDIILVNPSNIKETYGKLGESFSGIEPPLWIGLLAATLRDKGYQVKIIDADAQMWGARETVEEIQRLRPLLVGIGAIGSNPSAASTPKMIGVRRILNLIKEKNLPCKTFVYGIHPSGLPERTLREEATDFVVRGEAFYPVEELLRTIKSKAMDFNIKGLWYLKGGKVVDNGWADVVKDLDTLPFVAWDLLPMDKYRAHNWHCFGDIKHRSPYAMIYSSLGCPFNCHYCNIHTLYSGKSGIRFRSPKRVIEEIDWLYKNYHVKHMKILDELFVMNEGRMLEICDLLIERNYGINFWAYARVDTVSKEILSKLKKAGINWLAFGIEAGSHEVRQGVSKGRFDKEAIYKAIQMAHEAGIYVIGNFMFGLPDDTMETMQETFDLATELNCEYVNFYTTMAYPGSPLYEDAVAQGLELPKSWIGFSQLSPETLPLSTKHLSSAQVLRFRDNAFQTYCQSPRYLSMIKEKFGQETVDHIKDMLKHKIHRDILSEEKTASIST